jgi:hypothetical protein
MTRLPLGWRQELFAQRVTEPALVPAETPPPGAHEPQKDVGGNENPHNLDGGSAVQARFERALPKEVVDDDRRAARSARCTAQVGAPHTSR